MNALAVVTPTPNLAALCRQAFAEHGSIEAAIAAVDAILLADPKLRRSIIKAAIADAIDYRTRAALRHTRGAIIYLATRENPLTEGRAGVRALASGLKRALLDFPLAGGTKLRDAERDQVMREAERYGSAAGTMAHRARWYALIGQSVPPGKRVGQVLSEARVQELYQEAANV